MTRITAAPMARAMERATGNHQNWSRGELIQLLGLEKSLVYFSTSLKGNEVTLEKILRGRG